MGQTWRPFLLGSDTALAPSSGCAVVQGHQEALGESPRDRACNGFCDCRGGAGPRARYGQGNSTTSRGSFPGVTAPGTPGELPVGQAAPEPHCCLELKLDLEVSVWCPIWVLRGSEATSASPCHPLPPIPMMALLSPAGSPVPGGLWASRGQESSHNNKRSHYPVTVLPQVLASTSASAPTLRLNLERRNLTSEK